MQSPPHHATEITSHYSDRKASRSALLPRAAHKNTKVMSGILKSSLFKYNRKMGEEEKGKQSCFTINVVFSHMWHYRLLSNGQRTAASWCFLQKRTIKALNRQTRQNHLTLCKQQKVKVSRQQKECQTSKGMHIADRTELSDTQDTTVGGTGLVLH